MERSSARILIVDDAADTRALLVDVLGADGYDVHACETAEQALRVLQRQRFDLILADIRLPRMSGLDLLFQVRRITLDTKVILMTAYASLQSVIEALRGDADDYITKPFKLPELRRQVRLAVQPQPALLQAAAMEQVHGVSRHGNLTIDYDARRVYVGELEVGPTKQEFDLLAYLARRPGCAVSCDDLLREVWGFSKSEQGNHAMVKSCIFRIRKKLGESGRQPRYILNVRGVGYQLGV